MKVSVSLPEDDVRFLDAFAEEQGLDSRSAALQRAVRLLRTSELGSAYAAAWDEWASSGDADRWATTIDDGLDP
jgi:Arc/MetJ-type ribon-helix-helix transcriptional regulator